MPEPRGRIGTWRITLNLKLHEFLNGSRSFSLEGSFQLKCKQIRKGHMSNAKISS